MFEVQVPVEFTAATSAWPAPAVQTPWPGESPEGQLAVDVVQTDDDVIIVAPLAGTKPEHIEIHLHNDCLTIRGYREAPVDLSAQQVHQECFWGKFSRTIVLPVEVENHLARAEFKQGLLTIHIPKRARLNTIPIMVIDE